MDPRQFFEAFFGVHNELSTLMQDSLFGDKDLLAGQTKQSPRDMMLKNPIHSSPTTIEHNYGPNSNSSFERMYEEKVIVLDNDGVEKITTKHSEGGRLTTKEIIRKGDQIISEKKVVSDFPDNVQQFNFNMTNQNLDKDTFTVRQSEISLNSWYSIRNWFKW